MSSGSHAFLAEWGRRVRARREARGLAVGQAAESAGVSRRTWTEIEAGRANPSLIVLLGVADALGGSLAELFEGLARTRRRERVALFGLRGAGKSTVGRLLARELEAPFVELDQRIEALAGVPLAEVFALHGAAGFHRLEAEAVEAVLAEGERAVLATGGSIVDAPETFARLGETCRTVWLRASPEEHFRRVLAQGDRRPMAQRPRAMDELRQLLDEREPAYGACELELSTDGREPSAIVAELLAALAD